MVGHLLRYHPAFEELHRLVMSGELGRLQYVSSNRLSFGRFRREENSLWSFAPHDISMILALIGDEPHEVSAVGSKHLHTTIEDVTTTHLSFPGGQGAHVHVSWLHPVKQQELVVVGERGMAIFNDGHPWESKLQLFRHNVEWHSGLPVPAKAEAELVKLAPGEPLQAECSHFLECVASGKRPLTDAEEGLRVLRVLQRAQAALHGRERVVSDPEVPDGVHPTATIDEGVTLGAGARVWHHAHILSGSRIGAGSSLGQNVMVGPNVSIGEGCKIQNNVSVYEGVTLEDGVFCGPSMVFTNIRTPRAGWDRRSEFEKTLVKTGASIGANATIVCGVVLGEYSLVAAGAVVTRDVPAHALMVGAPARQVGWVSHAGERLGEDLVCPRTGDRYTIIDGKLERDA
jgi:UDP-2-acetamido-3-amino-2,3-dideoxy-glucuronate N-acetyltransferase